MKAAVAKEEEEEEPDYIRVIQTEDQRVQTRSLRVKGDMETQAHCTHTLYTHLQTARL